LNWLSITYNTVEELVRVAPGGKTRPATMRRYRWKDDRTLGVHVRPGGHFPDGEAMTTATVKRAFDEQIRWATPHLPGTHFNVDWRSRVGEQHWSWRHRRS
jgi:ABC-type transport system substrate-binding protein